MRCGGSLRCSTWRVSPSRASGVGNPPAALVHRYILNFIATNPTPEEIATFRPTLEMQQRLQTLIERSKNTGITEQERIELDEYERIEHLIIMLKAGNLRNLPSTL